MFSANIYSTTQSCILQIFQENHDAHLPPSPHCPSLLPWGTLPGGAQDGIMNEKQGWFMPGRRAKWVTPAATVPAVALTLLQGPNQSAGEKVAEPRSEPILPWFQSSGTILSRHTRPSQEIYLVTMTLELGLSLPSPLCSKSFSVTFQFHHITVRFIVSLTVRNSDFVVSAFPFWWHFKSQWVKATFGSCFHQEPPKVAAPSFTPSFVFTMQVTTNEGQTASWQSVEVKTSKSFEKRKVRREVESSRWKPLNSNHALHGICTCAHTVCPHWLTKKQQ